MVVVCREAGPGQKREAQDARKTLKQKLGIA